MDKLQEIKREFGAAAPRILKELADNPPTIGLIGVSGVGKSSTINAMFGTKLTVSATIACTKEFKENSIQLNFIKGSVQNAPVQLIVYDAPGLGEDINYDPDYIRMYHEHLSKCDVILWILTARNRAVALDQSYLQQLEAYHEKIVFGLNQVDLVDPLNWVDQYNIPSKEQEDNINAIIQDRQQKLQNIVKRKTQMIPYSSKTGYGLQELFTALITSCPPDRTWIFESLKAFHYKDFIPKEGLDLIDDQKKPSLFNRLRGNRGR